MTGNNQKDQNMTKKSVALVASQYRVPFVLLTSLFFLWGFAHAILDVLNKHFQELLAITRAHSALIQATMYMGYFVMAIPAGMFITRWGYRRGVVFGLLLYGIGSLLFIPGQYMMSFNMFVPLLSVCHRLRTGVSGNCSESLCNRARSPGNCCQPFKLCPVFQWPGMYFCAVAGRAAVVF